MKKFLKMAVISILCITLVGCGAGKPSNMSEEHYEAGVEALKIIDEYLDDKISQDTAYTDIKEIKDNLPEDVEELDGKVHLELSSFIVGFSEFTGELDNDKLKEGRDNFADLLGK